MHRLLCRFGIHEWKEIGPFLSDSVQYDHRQCARCGALQWWLPGCGGSEAGCWLPRAKPQPPVMREGL